MTGTILALYLSRMQYLFQTPPVSGLNILRLHPLRRSVGLDDDNMSKFCHYINFDQTRDASWEADQQEDAGPANHLPLESAQM